VAIDFFFFDKYEEDTPILSAIDAIEMCSLFINETRYVMHPTRVEGFIEESGLFS
jgi:hypothetical protein